MDILKKVEVLGNAGKWDTCASSASSRKTTGKDRIGNAASGGICHSFTPNGRCISLFKTLMTNSCTHDCKYCQNAGNCAKQKTMYEPQELAKIFMHLYTRNYVEGLFLSSAIPKDADITTTKMLEAVNIIKQKYKFAGYIHLKILPGTNKDLIKQAAGVSDRLSVNLEAPNSSRLSQVTDIKDYKTDILRRQAWIKQQKLPAGQTTQMVIGGTQETDKEILNMATWQYENFKTRRVYYSAFTPVQGTKLQSQQKTPLQREHRLYNVDFMLRQYKFKLQEFLAIMDDGNLPNCDPKIPLARNYFDGPIDVNNASQEELLRVPGIGPQSAERLIKLRRTHKITKREQLHSIGVVLKRARPFLKIDNQVQEVLTAW